MFCVKNPIFKKSIEIFQIVFQIKGIFTRHVSMYAEHCIYVSTVCEIFSYLKYIFISLLARLDFISWDQKVGLHIFWSSRDKSPDLAFGNS